MIPDDELLKTCPYCISDIPGAASRCRHCGSDLYAPVDGDVRGWFIIGFLLLLIGIGIVSGSNDGGGDWAYILVGVGGVLVQIGIIGAGVSIGRRDAARQEFDHRREHANHNRGLDGGTSS